LLKLHIRFPRVSNQERKTVAVVVDRGLSVSIIDPSSFIFSRSLENELDARLELNMMAVENEHAERWRFVCVVGCATD